jgi:cysta_beta: cystathionine beta-synthase
MSKAASQQVPFQQLHETDASFSNIRNQNHSKSPRTAPCKGNVMTIHNSLSELIGNTPLIRLNHVTEGIKATIAEVEYF